MAMFAICAGTPHKALSQAVAPAFGPTMEQTVAFINESFQKQGDVTWNSESTLTSTTFIHSMKWSGQSVQLENACSLVETRKGTFRDIVRDNDSTHHTDHDTTSVETSKTVLSMNLTDPFSVSVEPASDSKYYAIFVKRAVFSFRALDVPSNAVFEALPLEYRINAIVRSVSGSSLTIVTGAGHLVQVTLDSSADISVVGTGGSSPATASDIAVGDHLDVSRYMTTEGKKAQNVGHQSVSVTKTTSAERVMEVGYFTDKDLADRVAKALIHAIVLCHKDDKPSLF
jgi:hypothetical protein